MIHNKNYRFLTSLNTGFSGLLNHLLDFQTPYSSHMLTKNYRELYPGSWVAMQESSNDRLHADHISLWQSAKRCLCHAVLPYLVRIKSSLLQHTFDAISKKILQHVYIALSIHCYCTYCITTDHLQKKKMIIHFWETVHQTVMHLPWKDWCVFESDQWHIFCLFTVPFNWKWPFWKKKKSVPSIPEWRNCSQKSRLYAKSIGFNYCVTQCLYRW